MISLKEQIDNLVYKRTEIKNKSPYFKLVAGKIYIDGIVDNETAYLSTPYEKHPIYDENGNIINLEENYGYNLWENRKEDLKFVITELNRLGFQAHFHSTGDRATKFILDTLEEIPNYDKYIFRNLITHLQLIRKQDVERIKLLKLIASLQTFWDIKAPNDWYKVDYGKLGERAEYEYPLKSLLDARILITGASDYPVLIHPNPIIDIQIGASRNFCDADPDDFRPPYSIDDPIYLLNKYERILVIDMIRIFTKNSAYANFMDNEIGSLEVNKQADLIVLDKNFLEIKISDLHKANVLMTFFDGKVVYIKPDFINWKFYL